MGGGSGYRIAYDSADVTLYCGDATEFGSLHTAAAFVTDPPYARAGSIATGRSTGANMARDLCFADMLWERWFRDAALVLCRAAGDAGCGFVFCDYKTIKLVETAFLASGTGWYVSQGLIWDRDGTGFGSPFRASHEMIAFCRGPRFKYTGPRNVRNVFRHTWPYGTHPNHSAEKPVALLSTLIECVTRPGDTVLDLFAGSGSTLVAARASGRKAIGVEIDQAFCKVAALRLSQQVLFSCAGTGGVPATGPALDTVGVDLSALALDAPRGMADCLPAATTTSPATGAESEE